MSTINPTTFTDGVTDVASALYDVFYGVQGDSYEVINGRLSSDNMNTSVGLPKASYTHVQRGAITGGGGVAGTANLDYFSGNKGLSPTGSGHFAGVGFPPGSPKRYIPIPGASVQFYLPYEAYVLITWSITWTNDCGPTPTNVQDPDERLTDISLFIDGSAAIVGDVKKSPYSRCVGETFMGPNDVTISTPDKDLQDRYKSRVYSGHCLIDGNVIPALSQGYHSASLRISQHSTIKQSRVRARSMQYIYFKYGDS